MPGQITTGFKINGVDVGDISYNLVEKSYLQDYYPGLVPTFAQPGLWVWGYNATGDLADGTLTNRSSPVQTIAGGNNWRQADASNFHRAAIKTDGTLWLWGSNSFGNLGDNTVTRRSSPVQTVAGGNDWRQVSVSDVNSAAIKIDGTLWLWGYNDFGALGDNTRTRRSSPVQTVAGGNNWQQVSVGYHTAAIKTDGTLWLWGANSGTFSRVGVLGDDTATDRSSPVQTVAGGNNWQQVSCGDRHTVAVKTDGTLWTWGRNSNGQLGDNTTTNRSSPVQTVAGGTNWRQVGGNAFHNVAIKTDGTLWCWGQNFYGQLGDNTRTDRSSPVQTVAGGSNWRQLGGGYRESAAIKTDGTLWLWGNNSQGKLGDGTTTDRSSPVQTVAGGTNWRQISGSGSFIAIKESGDW